MIDNIPISHTVSERLHPKELDASKSTRLQMGKTPTPGVIQSWYELLIGKDNPWFLLWLLLWLAVVRLPFSDSVQRHGSSLSHPQTAGEYEYEYEQETSLGE